jgi:hypothetical protein
LWPKALDKLKNNHTMSPRPTLEQVAEQIAMLNAELTTVGRLLYEGLERPMQSLKSGRSPRALGLSQSVAASSELYRTLAEVLAELKSCAIDFRRYAEELRDPILQQQSQGLDAEFGFWQSFSERCQILLKKLTLIEDLEKLSALGRAPIQDAWEEVVALAVPNAANS